jgi:hypothetical protein
MRALSVLGIPIGGEAHCDEISAADPAYTSRASSIYAVLAGGAHSSEMPILFSG